MTITELLKTVQRAEPIGLLDTAIEPSATRNTALKRGWIVLRQPKTESAPQRWGITDDGRKILGFLTNGIDLVPGSPATIDLLRLLSMIGRSNSIETISRSFKSVGDEYSPAIIIAMLCVLEMAGLVKFPVLPQGWWEVTAEGQREINAWMATPTSSFDYSI